MAIRENTQDTAIVNKENHQEGCELENYCIARTITMEDQNEIYISTILTMSLQ